MKRTIYIRLVLDRDQDTHYDDNPVEEYTLQKEFSIDDESYDTYLEIFEKVLTMAGFELTDRRLGIIDNSANIVIRFREKED